MQRRNLQDAALYLAAFLLPLLAATAAFYYNGMAPFGDKFIAGWDCYTQYTEYFSWYRRVLTGDANLFYSFGKSLGGNTFGLFAYYLSSPLNLLIVFFDESATLDFMSTVCLLKIALCGLTAVIYLNKRFKLGFVQTLILAVCYALSQYIATLSICGIMWIDAMVLLPLVALGIYRYVTDKKRLLFFLASFTCVLANWFAAYMTFLFMILYFIYEYYLFFEGAGKKAFVMSLLRFGGLMAIAVLLSLFILLPVVFAQLEGSPGVFYAVPSVSYRPDKIVRSLFGGGANIDTVPQLFCGSFVMVMVLYYCFLKIGDKKAKRTRRAALIFLLVMLICTLVEQLTEVWGGFRYDRGYFCRFAFLLDFLLVAIAAQVLELLPAQSSKRVFIAALILISAAVYSYYQGGFISPVYFVLALAMVCLMCIALYFLPKCSTQKLSVFLYCAILIITTAELGVNYAASQSLLISGNNPVASYEDFRVQQRAALNELKASDPSFYRVEMSYSRLEGVLGGIAPTCDGLAMGYSQIENYCSTNDAALAKFFMVMGYGDDEMGSIDYEEPILVSDSLLGIKYVFNDARELVKNDSALPLGYAVANTVLGTLPALEDEADKATINDVFATQNDFISALLGKKVECFKALETSKVTAGENLEEWTVSIPEGSVAYAYMLTSGFTPADLTVGEDYRGEYNTWRSFYIFDISKLGDDTVKLSSVADDVPIGQQELQACTVDREAFQAAIAELESKSFKPSIVRDAYVEGSYSCDADELLFLTIPFDTGWNIEIDGQRVEQQKALDTFMVIPISAGTHYITMNYTPPGLKLGLAVSGLTLLAVLAAYFISRKHKHATQQNS